MTAANKLGRNYAGQDNLLALIATMAYVNEGETGKNGVIRREYIAFDLGSRHIEHRWYEFGSSDVQDGNITFKRTGEASPLPVTAGSAISHETLFAAWENDCENAPAGCDPGGNFVKWDDFLKAIKTNNRLVISTGADIYPSKRLTASCVVRLRDWEIAILEKEQWLTATCAEVGRRPSGPRNAARADRNTEVERMTVARLRVAGPLSNSAGIREAKPAPRWLARQGFRGRPAPQHQHQDPAEAGGEEQQERGIAQFQKGPRSMMTS